MPQLGSFWQDLRLAARMLAQHRVSSLAAVIALCLGIGPTTAIFSVVYGTLLAPLPYPDPDRLVIVWSHVRGGRNPVSVGDYLEWKARATSFEFLDTFVYRQVNLSSTAEPEAISVRMVSADSYRLHRVPVWLGRDFLPGEDQPGKDRVALLSHSLWSRRFGADPAIIGRDIRLNSTPYTVVGVLPPGTWDRLNADAWLPLAFTPEQRSNHDTRWLLVKGRLKPYVTREQAQQELSIIAGELSQRHPTSNAGWGVSVQPLQNNFLAAETQTNLWLLLAAVSFVVLIACVNVANLLLAQGSAREGEVAIRASLGATRAHLFRQALTESLLLAGIGGVLGVVSSVWILRGLLALMPQYTLPAEVDPQVNLPVLLFALTTTVVCGLVFGWVPAWHATRVDPNRVLRQGGRTAVAGRRGLRVFVVAQLALAVTLLAGAGLTIHSFWNRTRVDLGINPDHVLAFQLPIPEGRLDSAARIEAFYGPLLDRLQAIPGISRAAVSTGLPLLGGDDREFSIAGRPADEASKPRAMCRAVTPGFFDTFGVRVARGRSLTVDDNARGVRVAMVNERFADRFLGGLDPLREQLLIAERIHGTSTSGPAIEWQIVGVFHDVANDRVIGTPAQPEIYVPFSQSPSAQVWTAVRTKNDPETARRSIAAAVNTFEPGLPISNVYTMRGLVRLLLAVGRFHVALFAGLAIVALLLAAVGIYGVMAFLVAHRTSEIGLRMALGAGRTRILGQIVFEGFSLAIAGLGIGLVGAYAVGLAMRSTLYGTGAMNLRVAGMVGAVLIATTLAACCVPARRASAVDPMTALRQA
jgi:putative ABC transport system permease protein